MVGLGQVGQLKIKGECARELLGLFDWNPADRERRLLHQLLGIVRVAFTLACVLAGALTSALTGSVLGLTTPDRRLPQLFHLLVERLSGLLAQHLAQQHAERAHIASQRRFLQLTGACFQLSKALRPVFRLPQWRHHAPIMPEPDVGPTPTYSLVGEYDLGKRGAKSLPQILVIKGHSAPAVP